MLKDLIDTQLPTEPSLPISHVTDWHSVESIVKNGCMSCEVSAEKTICFFYGAPLYKINLDGGSKESTGLRHRRPIGLVFKSDLIKEAAKLYPFDSGAFDKYFKAYFPSTYSLSSFEITPVENSTPAKIVSMFYETNENYIFGEPVKVKDLDHVMIEGLMEIFGSKSKKAYDERNHGIELQYKKDVSIKDNLELIVFPKTIFKKFGEQFDGFLKGFEILTYEDSYRFDPVKDSILVQAKIKEYFGKKYFNNSSR